MTPQRQFEKWTHRPAVDWWMGLLTGDARRAAGKPSGSFPWVLFVLFLVLTAAIGTIGFFYLGHQQAEARRATEEELATIADLKVAQIVNWREERLADATTVLESHTIADHFQQLLANPADTVAKSSVLNSMAAWQEHMHYARVLLLDPNQEVRFAVPAGKDWVDPTARSLVAQALRANQVLIADLHISPVVSGYVNMDVLVPLLPAPEGASTAREAVGVLLFEVDPATYLYPLIQSWHTPSHTAETLLVRRDGDDVLYLNELRHRTSTALKLRMPMSQPNFPAALAILGQKRVADGFDYRNVAVVAAMRPIPGSPWFLVAEVDQVELYARTRRDALATGLIVGVLWLAVTLGVSLLWRQRGVEFLRRALAQEQQRQALAQRIAHLTKHANDIILLADRDWRILEANDRALEAYGRTLAELRSMTVRDLRSAGTRAEFASQTSRVDATHGALFETVHQRKDGSTFPVENSARAVELGGVTYYQCILRDITERKQAEEALRALSIRQQAIVAAVPELIMEVDCNKIYTWANQGGLEFFGSDVIGKDAAYYFEGEQATYDLVQPLFVGDENVIYVESWQRRKDGQKRLLAWWCRVLKDESGRVTGALSSARDITERKQAEEALEASDTRFQSFMRHFPGLAYVKDSEGRVVFANEGFSHYLRLKPATMHGKSNHDLFPAEFAEKITRDDRRILESGRTDTVEEAFAGRHWVTYKFPIPQPGALPLLGGLTIDITERKQAEAARQESELKYHRLHDTMTDAFVLVDMAGHILECNRTYRDMLGYTEAELRQLTYVDLTPEEWHAFEARIVGEQILPQGFSGVYEKEYRHKDGTLFPVELRVSLLRDDAGQPEAMWAIVRDITERKRAEAALRESEDKFRAIIDSSPVALAVNDEHKNITFLNRKFIETFGYTLAEIPTLAEWWPRAYPNLAYRQRVAQEWQAAVEKARRDRTEVELVDYRVTCINGAVRDVHFSLAPMGTSHLVMLYDITERKRAEEQVLRLNAELEQRVLDRTAQLAAKNEELKGFAYTVSHDLKAPLRGIAAYAQELERRHKEGLAERAQFCITQIITASRNLDALIEDLLQYSRLDAETPTLTDVQLPDLVRGILRDSSHTLTRLGVEVIVNVPPLTLRSWERGLHQVLTNLVDNAIKYSSKANSPRLAITAEAVPGAIRVTVADNGIGFDMKYHDRIFGLFNRLVRASEFEGTGAGLAIVKKLIEKLGGTIHAESAPGQGATFFVELPHQPTAETMP